MCIKLWYKYMLCQVYRIIFLRGKHLWHWSNLDIDSIHPNMTLARVWYAMLAVTIVCVLMHVCVCVCACVCVCVRERECVCVCGSRGATSHNIAWLSLEPRGHGVRGGLNLRRKSKDLFSSRFFCIAFAFSAVVLMALSRHLQSFC